MKTGLLAKQIEFLDGASLGFGARVADAISRRITKKRVARLSESTSRKKLGTLLLPLVDDKLSFLVPMAIAKVDMDSSGTEKFVSLSWSDCPLRVNSNFGAVMKEAFERKYGLLSFDEAFGIGETMDRVLPGILGVVLTIPFVESPAEAEDACKINALEVNGTGLSLGQVTLPFGGNNLIHDRVFIFKTGLSDRSDCFNPQGIFSR